MTRLQAIKASPLGYARRGELLAAGHSLFHEHEGVAKPVLWSPGMAGAEDWEPVMPESPVERPPVEETTTIPPSGGVVEETGAPADSALIPPGEAVPPSVPTLPAPVKPPGREYRGRRR